MSEINKYDEDGVGEIDVPLHLPCYMTGFLLDVTRMNAMYKMPEVDGAGAKERLKQFKSILEEECKEIDDIVTINPFMKLTVKTALADLLGDIIVYCASEAKRWNIPIDRVLNIIMQSNFSKLDSNGMPIYDERMKLMKGPNYWKPEPKIAELLKGEMP
jgi:NTP pyrophosphatase (non-canonical NTP hydrolase)